MIAIRNVNTEDDYLAFQIYGPDTADGTIRLAVIETTVSEWATPDAWLAGNAAAAQALIDAGEYQVEFAERVDFADFAERATAEIDWLEATIPQIDTMTAAEVRSVVKRLVQENVKVIKSLRYLARRWI